MIKNSTIRLSVTKDFQVILDFLKQQYPLLDASELIKMALSRFYYEQREKYFQQKAKEAPIMELTAEEQTSLTQALTSDKFENIDSIENFVNRL